MGTRNLTVVKHNNTIKIAQYGQWDGYPDGQGLTILEFLSNSNNVSALMAALPRVRFANEHDVAERDAFLVSIGSTDGWVNQSQSAMYDKKYPLDSRDIAGEILERVALCEDHEIVLRDNYSFGSDEVSCEWVYEIDLDKNALNVYDGCISATPTQTFNLSNLPSSKEFLSLF